MRSRCTDPLHALDPEVVLSCGVPQPSVLVRICYCQRSWVLLSLSRGPGAGSQFSTDYPAFASAQAARGPWPGAVSCQLLPGPLSLAWGWQGL